MKSWRPSKVLETLKERLQAPQGVESDEAVQVWLADNYGVELCYFTVHGLVHTRLKAHPQIVPPHHAKRDDSNDFLASISGQRPLADALD